MNGRHDTRGSMILIPVVSGSGPMTIQITNAQIEGVLSWGLDARGHITIFDQWTWFDASVIRVRMEGFGLLTNTINNNINDAIPTFLADPEFQAELNRIINGIMFPSIEQLIYETTPEEFTLKLATAAANPTPDRCLKSFNKE